MTRPSDYRTTTAAAYDSVAELYAEMARDELSTVPFERSMISVFAEFTRSFQAERKQSGGEAGLVAELGCGPGRVTAHLRDLGLDTFGIDLSPVMIDLATKTYPDLRFEVGSMDDLDIPDASLDGAVAWYSIIHAPADELPRFFAEFSRVLVPGGYLLLGFFEAGDGNPITPFDHRVTTAYAWPIGELVDLAGEAGFAEVGRMTREPNDDERRLRRGHLLMRLTG
ncbi:methyltransferase family protein [Stackebrandtia endophytica]|uniref:Methyltransferase family protein n=1 Tax=Stackebrandtia endophytica TaxID=1496996 RepID=A0A543B200_9ACTN|nr:class I SAM-dependent methyltransferase [Stackebrandtia endophytica]TQL78859.1 methyltransferase family protein [Stackebrandtia endophytica]